MRTWTKRLLSTPLVIALAAPPIWAADSCPAGCPVAPANSHYVSTPGPIPNPAFAGPILAATLKKGKKKRVVVVEASVSTAGLAPGAPVAIALTPHVNGIFMEPLGGFGAIADCGSAFLAPVPPPFACTVTGSFWLDVDANPVLINAPLTVTLLGGDPFGPGVGIPIIATMSVRLEKK